MLSPVDVSTAILSHIRDAWNQTHPDTPLASQDVVLTVPASFDEEARELTVQAAHDAGIEKLTLVEEPAAAFYSWIANHLAQSQKSLFDGQLVLVCDVGGGTSDFTLIRVHRDGDRIEFTRTAVGKHLLLGGDNLDLTLAWLVESKLGTQLSIRQRTALRRQCAAAKERMLADPNLKTVEITVLGAGSSLVGGTLKTEITREEALELTLEGFLPFCGIHDKPTEEKRSLFRELGLPYVSDPAVTRHLAAFLSANEDAKPDAILFNGGFFIPEICQQRVADVMERWYGRRPAILENRDLDLAVAVGAAYYSYVKATGAGLLVRGGLPRSYYVGVGDNEAVCLVPRGAEEGQTLELDSQDLHLVANKPVSFRLYSSLTRVDDPVGRLLADGAIADLHLHAPLNAVIRFGKAGERLVPVKLRAHLTEVGTLEVWADSKISEHHWRLQFELRKTASARTGGKPAAVVSDEAVAQAEALIEATFRDGTPDAGRASRQSWNRRWPWDAIPGRSAPSANSAIACSTSPSAAANPPPSKCAGSTCAASCCAPASDFQATIFASSRPAASTPADIQFPNQVQNEIDWWIFWGRVAGGLNKNQQVDIFQRLSPVLSAARLQTAARSTTACCAKCGAPARAWSCLPLQTKTQLGDALIAMVKKGDMVDTGLVVPVAARRAEAVLRPHQSSSAGASRDALGGGIAQSSQGRRRRSRHCAAHRRFHARFEPRHHRNDPQTNSRGSAAGARRRSRRGSGQSVWRRAAVRARRCGRVTPAVTEDSIITKLRRRAPLIGDDCAVIPSRSGHDLLLKADLSIEGVHFTRDSSRRRNRRARGCSQLERHRRDGRNAAVLPGFDGARTLDR